MDMYSEGQSTRLIVEYSVLALELLFQSYNVKSENDDRTLLYVFQLPFDYSNSDNALLKHPPLIILPI